MNDLSTDWIGKWARYSPDATAFEDGDTGHKVSYQEADQVVRFLAHQLREHYDVQKGDRVAVLATNIFEYVYLLFVAQKLGAILVPINFRLTERELSHILSDSDPKVLIVEQALKDQVKNLSVKQLLDFDSPLGLQGWAKEASNHPDTDFPNASEFSDPCLILYTSGTTGSPKGAVLTNESIFWNSVNTSLRLNLSQDDITINFAPFFHTGGWNVLTTPMVHRGGHIVFMKKFDPEHMLQLCVEKGVTIFFGVPTTLAMMTESPSFQRDLSSVRYAIVGGEPMPLELIRTWNAKGVPIRQGYGLTEFGPNVFSLNEEDAVRKMGSVGFANFYIETRVINSEGQDCQPGEIGELALKGPMAMKEYWQNPEATAETLKEGWLSTGDLVQCDEEGYFYIVGRKKEMYISGGENVYPVEIEQVLQSLDGVKEAAVIGVEDEKWGEVGRAFIVCEESQALSEGDILSHCEANLARFKVPKSIVFLDELPKGDSGKILKRSLK